MKVEKTVVSKIQITDIEHLDAIGVIFEDLGPRQGKITIDCYSQAWSAYWGGMGDRTIAQFFCSCDEHYLAKNLSNINSTVDDLDGLGEVLQKKIIQNRLDGDIDKATAREQYDASETVEPHSDHDFMYDVLGDEWWYDIPSKPNPDYEYLCRIINTVKAALKEATP